MIRVYNFWFSFVKYNSKPVILATDIKFGIPERTTHCLSLRDLFRSPC